MRHAHACIWLAAATFLLSACDRDVLPPDYDTALTIAPRSGDNQFVAAGGNSQPLSVTVTDKKGRPAKNVTVRWQLDGPDQERQAVERTTNVVGVSDVVFTLSPTAGRATATASLMAPFTGSVSFGLVAHVQGATQMAAAPASRSVVDSVRAILQPYAVIVRDHQDRPVAGVKVQWRITVGGGSLQSSESVSNASGVAQNVHTLGQQVGIARVVAEVAGLPGSPLTFVTTVINGQPVSFRKISGDNQIGATGTDLHSFYVGLYDTYGNAVPRYRIDWLVTSGDGVLAFKDDLTSAFGVASAVYRLGQAEGTHVVSAAVNGFALPQLQFTSTARSGAVVSIINTSSYYYYYYYGVDSGYFDPPYLGVNRGTKVTWFWPCPDCSADLLHKIVFENDSTGVYTSPEQKVGSFSRTFTAGGSYRYRCVNHSTDFTHGMVGEVVVIN